MTESISINTQILQPLRPELLMLEIKPTFLLHGPMLLGAFPKLRKATILDSSRVPVRMGQLGSHWTNFREISYLSIIRKAVRKIQD